MIREGKHLYEFGPFLFDPEERILWRDAETVPLTPRAFEALYTLVSRSGHLVAKQDLMREIWGDAVVEPGNLAVIISVLRKALGEDGAEHKYIQTVSKLGYRFVGDVRETRECTVAASEPPPVVKSASPLFRRLSISQVALSIAGLLILSGFGMVFSFERGLVVGDRRVVSAAPARNMSAYRLYLQGRYLWSRRNTESLKRSLPYFQQAIAEDPSYARAYAGLADSLALLSFTGPGKDLPAQACTAAEHAIQLDPSLADPHASLGLVALFHERDWKTAEREFKRAIALDPNCTSAHQRYGLALVMAGRIEESLAALRRAVETDPLSPIVNADVGWALYLGRRYDDAIDSYLRVIDLDPYFAPAHMYLGMAYIQKGRAAEAIDELRKSQQLSRDNRNIDGILGYALARAGDTAASRIVLMDLTRRSRLEYVPPLSVALVCVGLGQNEEAVQWLSKAYDAHNKLALYARTDPSLDPLRSNLRFDELLRRSGLRTMP